jgi:hypothetical protein
MKRLRIATEAEIEAIREGSDLDATCQIVALDTQAGTPIGVIRLAVEVDPVYFPPDFPDRLKYIFIRDIETHLAAKGVLKYYFQMRPEDIEWQEVAKSWGAIQQSPAPELRFGKTL